MNGRSLEKLHPTFGSSELLFKKLQRNFGRSELLLENSCRPEQ